MGGNLQGQIPDQHRRGHGGLWRGLYQMESTNLFGATSRGGETYNLLDVARLGSRL